MSDKAATHGHGHPQHGHVEHGHKPHHEHPKAEKAPPTAAYIDGCTDPLELANIAQEYGDLANAATTRIAALANPPSADQVVAASSGVSTQNTAANSTAMTTDQSAVPLTVSAVTETRVTHPDGTKLKEEAGLSVGTVVSPETVDQAKKDLMGKYKVGTGSAAIKM